MRSSDRRRLYGLTAGVVALLPVAAEAQMRNRSSEELMPITGHIVVAIEKTIEQTRSEASKVSVESSGARHALVRPPTAAGGWLEGAAGQEVHRLTRSTLLLDSALRSRQQPAPPKRSWIGRHPVLFGTLVGFGGGFLIGYVPGDDGVFDDYVASFNGLVMGGIGAGAGAAIGAAAGASTK
jgi:hypothetical protein